LERFQLGELGDDGNFQSDQVASTAKEISGFSVSPAIAARIAEGQIVSGLVTLGRVQKNHLICAVAAKTYR